MKLYLKIWLALGAIVVAGCGDDGNSTPADTGLPDSALDARVADSAMIDARLIDARVAPDAFVPMATTDAGTGAITCGATMTCNGATQKCCVMMAAGGGAVTSMCVANADPCTGGGAATCDGTEDCPGSGQVCCATANAGAGQFMASCKQYGTGAGQCSGEFSLATQSGDVVACNNMGDCPSDKRICQRCTYNGMTLPPFCTDSLLSFPPLVSCTSVP
jgi:hypothetical protein